MPWSSGNFKRNFAIASSESTNWMFCTRGEFSNSLEIWSFCAGDISFFRKKTTAISWDICWAVYRRLFERDTNIPTIRNDKHMIVTENTFLALNCQRLFRVSRWKCFNFCVIKCFPLSAASLCTKRQFFSRNSGSALDHGCR